VIGGFAIGPLLPERRVSPKSRLHLAAGSPGEREHAPSATKQSRFGRHLLWLSPDSDRSWDDNGCGVLHHVNHSTRVMLSAGGRAGVVRRQPSEPNDDEAAQRLP